MVLINHAVRKGYLEKWESHLRQEDNPENYIKEYWVAVGSVSPGGHRHTPAYHCLTALVQRHR